MIVPAACMFASAASAQNGQLPWSDEFNGTNGSDWVLATGNGGGGWGNKGLQYCRRQNAGIKNNALVINAKCEDFGAYGYTSARMKTQGVLMFKHWKIEARMKLPSFMGAWPAFWMLGANLPQNDRATSLVVSRVNQAWALTLQAQKFSTQNGVQVEACLSS